MTLVDRLRQRGFRALRDIELWAAYWRGKGYGVASTDREVAAAIHLLGRPPSLVVDIGANVGQYAQEMRRAAPNAQIHSFEPSPVCVTKLRSLFESDQAVCVNQLALSDVSGAATLYGDERGTGLGSLVKRDLAHLSIPFEPLDAVTTIRFEKYWNETLGRAPIDIAKLDIEGHELAALKGFGEALGHVQVLQFECGGTQIDSRTFFRDFYFLLKPLGFALYRIAPLGLESIWQYTEEDESFAIANILARRIET